MTASANFGLARKRPNKNKKRKPPLGDFVTAEFYWAGTREACHLGGKKKRLAI